MELKATGFIRLSVNAGAIILFTILPFISSKVKNSELDFGEPPIVEENLDLSKDTSNEAVIIFSLIVAVVTLMLRTYFGWKSSQLKYYSHLSKIWYDLKSTEIEKPDWSSFEYTSMYSIRRASEGKSEYEAFAWSSLALAEDCYETYWNKEGTVKFISILVDRILKTEKKQFWGPIKNAYEYHWNWLSCPENSKLFSRNFFEWLEMNFEVNNYAVTENSKIHGKGLIAKKKFNPSEYIGHFQGTLTSIPTKYTIQVGINQHIEIPENHPFKYLNHSGSPNAKIEGLNLVAVQDIDVDEEITINYNASELVISSGFESSQEKIKVLGFDNLSVKEKIDLQPIVHSWIKKKRFGKN